MKTKKILLYWAPVIAYAAGIYIFSGMPHPPQVLPSGFPYSDKIYHFIEYAVFSFLILRALYSSKDGIKADLRLLAFGLALFYGLTDEFHQHFVPGRDASVFDLLVDGLGAFIGQLFYKIKK